MRDTRGDLQQPDDKLVDELEQLAVMLLERGRIAIGVRHIRNSDSPPPAEPPVGDAT